MTRLHIDWTRCVGRGLCTELLPELLDRDDWGYPLSNNRFRDNQVPEEFGRFAKEAVKRCPRMALRLIDD